jgi:hypothetical protein
MTGSSGISSTLRLSDSITGALDYWIARFSAGDDGWEYSAFVLNELPPLQFFQTAKTISDTSPRSRGATGLLESD